MKWVNGSWRCQKLVASLWHHEGYVGSIGPHEDENSTPKAHKSANPDRLKHKAPIALGKNLSRSMASSTICGAFDPYVMGSITTTPSNP